MQCTSSSFVGNALAFQPASQQRQRVQLRVVAKDSRIGKVPIPVPAKVEVKVDGQHVHVKVRRADLGVGKGLQGASGAQEGTMRHASGRQREAHVWRRQRHPCQCRAALL
jgi:hypothetical protein